MGHIFIIIYQGVLPKITFEMLLWHFFCLPPFQMATNPWHSTCGMWRWSTRHCICVWAEWKPKKKMMGWHKITGCAQRGLAWFVKLWKSKGKSDSGTFWDLVDKRDREIFAMKHLSKVSCLLMQGWPGLHMKYFRAQHIGTSQAKEVNMNIYVSVRLDV